MTTDLTDDSELDEEEFDWDVFLPDPDDAEMAAEAAALDEEDDLDLDDSDFDWEAALRDDAEQEPGTDGSAHAGAAFDRIVATVRRSFEEPESESEVETEAELESEAELDSEAELAVEPAAEAELEVETELEAEAELEYVAPEPAWELATELEPEAEPLAEPEDELALETELEPDEDLKAGTDVQAAWRLALAAEFGWEVEDPLASQPGLTSETNSHAEPDAVPVAMAVPEPVVSWEQDLDLELEPEPDLEVVEATEWPWEDVGENVSAGGPSDARTRGGEREKRSRIFTTTVVLACVFAGIVAGAAAERSIHHPTTAATNPPADATAPVSSTADAAQIQTATDAVDSATTAAQVALAALSSFPTPANVAREINPYLSSLQLYGSFLSGRKVPEQARSAATGAEAEVQQDSKFLSTLDGLPPLQLGAYLEQFETDATQLQATLSALEKDLPAPTS